MTKPQIIKKKRLINILKSQFLKYYLSGGVYFWLGYFVFFVMFGLLHHGWFISKIIADVIGWSANYFLQRYLVFNKDLKKSEIQHIYRYLLLEGSGFIIDYYIIWQLLQFGITPFIGFFVSSGFFTLWKYFWYKYFVFV